MKNTRVLKGNIAAAASLPLTDVAQAAYDAHQDHKKKAHDAWARRVAQSATDNTLCLILDFSESIMLPYFRIRPSQLYFLSMPCAHICGVYDCTKTRFHQHDVHVCLDTQGSFKNSDGVVTSVYLR